MADDILPDDALVCRGGLCQAVQFERGSGVSRDPDGKLHGISVNSDATATFVQLSRAMPHQKVGCSTVGAVRLAGGTVTPSPTSRNPYHCVMSGLTAKQAQELFYPPVLNPNVSR